MPLFMTELGSIENNIQLQAMQALIYDPDDLCEKGNILFKEKKFTEALHSYSEGLCFANDEQKARILGNKAAVYMQLQDYKNCVLECLESIKLKQSKKISDRLARAYFHLFDYENAAKYAQGELLENTMQKLNEDKKKQIEKYDKMNKSFLQKNLEPLKIIIYYPEFQQFDVIDTVDLNSTIREVCLTVLPLPWDQRYTLETIEVFKLSYPSEKQVKIDKTKTLLDILQSQDRIENRIELYVSK